MSINYLRYMFYSGRELDNLYEIRNVYIRRGNRTVDVFDGRGESGWVRGDGMDLHWLRHHQIIRIRP